MTGDASPLRSITGEWDELWRADPRATPFQSPAWNIAWWETLGGGELHVLAAREGSRLVALLPMFVWVDKGARRLMPVGVSHGDYQDALVRPGHEAFARETLLAAIAELNVDSAEVPDARAGGHVAGWGLGSRENTCPVLDLTDPAAVPRKLLRDAATAERRAGALGQVVIEAVADIPAALAILAGFQGARFGAVAVLADDPVAAFHRAAAPALAQAGVLRLTQLTVGGAVRAVYYGMVDGTRAYGYLIGADCTDPRQSFGTLLIRDAVAHARVAGLAEFHFLRGEEGYKSAWGAADRPTLRVRLR